LLNSEIAFETFFKGMHFRKTLKKMIAEQTILNRKKIIKKHSYRRKVVVAIVCCRLAQIGDISFKHHLARMTKTKIQNSVEKLK